MLEDIYNFRKLNDRLATGGQPTEEQLKEVAAAGFEVVINLALHDADYALPDERGSVEALGMHYEHIPVAWERPTRTDVSSFFQAMDRHGDRRCFVHCAANKRVSAFMALYRIRRLGWDETRAMNDLLVVWEPDEIWRRFISEFLVQGARPSK